MEKMRGSWLAATVIVTFLVMFPKHSTAGDLKLTLVVYDHAHLGSQKVGEIESSTSEIFRGAGVQLIWVEGFAYAAQRRDILNPAPEDPATLVVKLQPESEAARYGVRSVCGGIGFASGVIIFARTSDRRSGVADVTRLGHVIAQTPTQSLESCARRCFSRTGRMPRKEHLASPRARTSRSEPGSPARPLRNRSE